MVQKTVVATREQYCFRVRRNFFDPPATCFNQKPSMGSARAHTSSQFVRTARILYVSLNRGDNVGTTFIYTIPTGIPVYSHFTNRIYLSEMEDHFRTYYGFQLAKLEKSEIRAREQE